MRRLLESLRRLTRARRSPDRLAELDCHVPSERFGSSYGGWEVAVDYLNQRSVVYSFGIGEDASFDLALIERFGLTVHAFDPTPRSLQWIRGQALPSRFIVHEYGLADRDGWHDFYPPANRRHVSFTIVRRSATSSTIRVPMKRLATILTELGHERCDLLKLDIEGAEYAVIDDLARTDIRPAQLLVEFHHRFPNLGVAATSQAIATLRQLGYRLFSISQAGTEYGFLLPSGGVP